MVRVCLGVLRDARGIGRRQEVGKIVVLLSGKLRWRGRRLDFMCADVSRNDGNLSVDR